MKRLRLIHLFILAGLFLLVIGCCDHCFLSGPPDDTPPYFDARIYYPLVEGNWWEYAEADKEYPWTLEREIRYDFPFEDTICHIEREESFYFTGWQRSLEEGRRIIYTDTLFDVMIDSYEVTVDDVTFFVSDTFLEMRHILNPLRPGATNTWAANDPLGPLGTYTWTQFVVDTTLTLSRRTFEHCIGTRKKYRDGKTGETSRVEEIYYAPFIGPVMIMRDLFNHTPGDRDTTTVWQIRNWTVELDSSLTNSQAADQ